MWSGFQLGRSTAAGGARSEDKNMIGEHDIGRSDESKCQACHKEEGTEKHRLYQCPEWYEVRREIPEAFSKWEQKARTSKE